MIAKWLTYFGAAGIALGLLAITPTAKGSCYGRFYSPSYITYQAPAVKIVKEYVKEYVPVATYLPFAYVQTYASGYGAVLPAAGAAFPVAAPLPPPNVPRAAVAGPLPNDVVQMIVTEFRSLKAEMSELRKRVNGVGPAPAPPGVAPGTPPGTGGGGGLPPGYGAPGAPPPGASASPTPPGGPEVESKGDKALAIYGARCAACHGASAAETKGGGFTLLDSTGRRAPLSQSNVSKFSRHMVRDTMPPADNEFKIPRLTDKERTDLLDDLPNFPTKRPNGDPPEPKADGVRLIRAVIR